MLLISRRLRILPEVQLTGALEVFSFQKTI
uniref:Uncharacterized protein n=1 Tax=Anguilla anguilla TaxID=7936 RepID=A0A0E9URP3_ANGAN